MFVINLIAFSVVFRPFALSGSLFSQQFSACRVEGKIKQTENFVSSWNLCDLKQKCYSIKNRDILIRFWRRDVLHCWNYSLLWNKVASICMASIESYCKHRKLKMIFLIQIHNFQVISCYCRDKSFQINYFQLQKMQKLAETTSRILKDIKVIRQLWGLAKSLSEVSKSLPRDSQRWISSDH